MIAAGKCRKDIAKLEVDSHNQSSIRKLANIANLSIADEEFINNVNCDIEHFLKQRFSNGVLLFPPVNNFRRFLIHQTCERFRNKYDLFTFSVGQGPFRRTVICFKNQLLDPHKYSDTAATANFETRHKYTTPTPLKSWRSDNRRFDAATFATKYTAATTNKRELKMGVDKSIVENKINKPNAGELYRPPALRNHDNEVLRRYEADPPADLFACKITKDVETKESTTTSSPTVANASITTTTSISCNNSPIHRNENVINNCTPSSTQQNSAGESQLHQQQVDEQQKQPQRQQQTRRERRPDRAVYIPRARRSQTTPPNTTITQLQPPTQQQQQSTQLPVVAPTKIEETSKSLNQQLAIALDDTTTASVHHRPSSQAVEVGNVYSGAFVDITCCNNLTTTVNKKEKSNKESREQRREKRLQKKLSIISTQYNQIHNNDEESNENSINTISNNDNDDEIANQALGVNVRQMQSSLEKNDVNNFIELNDNVNNLSKGFNCDSSDEYILNKEPKLCVNTTAECEVKSLAINPDSETEFLSSISDTSKSQFLYKTSAHSIEINCKSAATNTSIITVNSCNTNTMPKPTKKTKSTKTNTEVLNEAKLPSLHIEYVASQQSPAKCDVEEQELQRASKEINRSNRRIIKQTFISDILQIPDHVNEDKPDVAEESNDSVAIKEQHVTSQIDGFTEDEEEEDDWENMFDDSGDCLDPKIMQELTASVGKCKIELPKMDYSAFLTKQSILNEEEFPHVLEVSNFPVEFKNQDLLMVFAQYKESGFDIKWVDDTHALAVFSSSRIAAEVLTMGHPFVVLKPLAEATIESRLKAKKCAASLQPYRPRPETCAALARRLVTGALGVRLKTAAAERENEKRVLREAKERKLLAAKQRDEVWDS